MHNSHLTSKKTNNAWRNRGMKKKRQVHLQSRIQQKSDKLYGTFFQFKYLTRLIFENKKNSLLTLLKTYLTLLSIVTSSLFNIISQILQPQFMLGLCFSLLMLCLGIVATVFIAITEQKLLRHSLMEIEKERIQIIHSSKTRKCKPNALLSDNDFKTKVKDQLLLTLFTIVNSTGAKILSSALQQQVLVAACFSSFLLGSCILAVIFSTFAVKDYRAAYQSQIKIIEQYNRK
jgi:uncharacterized membrane protein (DUF106 family)